MLVLSDCVWPIVFVRPHRFLLWKIYAKDNFFLNAWAHPAQILAVSAPTPSVVHLLGLISIK